MTDTLKQTPLTCSGHTRPVVDLRFSGITEHGYFLISASKDGKPMLRQGETGDWIGTFQGHKGAVWGATITRDACLAATGAADFTAKLWDAISGEEIYTFSHNHIVRSVDFANTSNKLLTAGNEKKLKIFDIATPENLPEELVGHTQVIGTALWSGDDKKIFSASEDNTVRVWDVASKNEIVKLEFPSSPINLQLSADKQTLIICYGRTVSFYNAETMVKKQEIEATTSVNTAALHPDNQTFVCGGEDFLVYKHDYDTGLEIESSKCHFGQVHCLRFSPDGQIYASGSEDGTLRLWQTTVGKTYGLWKADLSNENDSLESLSNGVGDINLELNLNT